ncbi:MAG: cytochrome c oxidase subunit 3 [Bacteroidia bacterium]|jgi:cytochrome c oxidase subunit 3|nr:cytochrome c oxidase subunit 3 [Bacteroidia bacterium]
MEGTIELRNEEKQRLQKGQRGLLGLGIFSIVMLFAGLTSAYVVRRDGGEWYSLIMPDIFKVSTAIILFSSLTINFALWAFKKNKKQLGVILMSVTLLLGMGFCFTQVLGWEELTRNGIFFVSPDKQPALISGSFLYLFTGLHLLHLAGGFIALIITTIKSAMGAYNSSNTHGVQLCSTYWHFLDGLWIYLFLFLTFFK